MSTTDSTRHVDLAPRRRLGLPHLATGLGVVAVLLSFAAWDWFDWGGVALGVPIAAAAFVLGIRARRQPGRAARALGTTAIVLAVIVVLIPLVFLAS
jgi:ABC-type glycerol-3-phosphate transport system permease component